jgi:hypothetical protein
MNGGLASNVVMEGGPPGTPFVMTSLISAEVKA